MRSLLIGVAPPGGVVPSSWWETIHKAVHAGFDIVSGLHQRLSENERLADAAVEAGVRLIDIRVPPKNLPIATGKKRSGHRVLTVGTDCAVGKKYTALGLHKSMVANGMDATFRATGQTGIMIAGSGIPIDAVVCDFTAGAAELISPDNDPSHWDVVEGQGSLFHPAYAGVSLGLLHGSQPDAVVLCHEPSRRRINSWEHYSLPTISECIERNLLEGRLTNPAIRCVGISINSSAMSESQRKSYRRSLENEFEMPCVDPVIDGCDPIAGYIKSVFAECSQ